MGYTPFAYAILYKSHDALKTLLHHEKFENTYTVSKSQETMLHLATCWGNLHTLKLLHSAKLKGVFVDGQDMYGWTALRVAQWRRDENTLWSEHELLPPDEDPAKWYAAFEELLNSVIDPVTEYSSSQGVDLKLPKRDRTQSRETSKVEPRESEDTGSTDIDEDSEDWSDAPELPLPLDRST